MLYKSINSKVMPKVRKKLHSGIIECVNDFSESGKAAETLEKKKNK